MNLLCSMSVCLFWTVMEIGRMICEWYCVETECYCDISFPGPQLQGTAELLDTPCQQPSSPLALFICWERRSNQEHHHYSAGGREGNDREREETEGKNKSEREAGDGTNRERGECEREPRCEGGLLPDGEWRLSNVWVCRRACVSGV